MFWDILIAVGVGITQLVTTIYGVWVSVAEHQIRNAIVIAAVGLVGIGLTIVGTVRSTTSLAAIERNTQPHARVVIEPKQNNEALAHPIVAQHPILLNFMFMNLGNQAGKHDRLFARAFVQDGNPELPDTIERVWREFADWMRATDSKHLASTELPFGVPFWSTNEPPDLVLTRDQILEVVSGKSHIFLTVYVQFEDDLGKHAQEACFYIQAPVNQSSPWHDCGLHNAQVDF